MSEKLLRVKDLKVYYPVRGGFWGKKKEVHALDGVSFELNEGETLGLVGESGCGKSTLGRSLVRLEKPTGGEVYLNGTEITSMPENKLRKLRKDFQMIFQDPYGSLNPQLSIFCSLDEVLRIHSGIKDLTQRRIKAAELLNLVGINEEALDRYPHQFSGGQRQRIGIARALAAEPKFIVADEPVSALDVSVQAAIINLLSEIQTKTKVAFLFIAHDIAVVEHICDRIMVMYLGKIVEQANAKELIKNTMHPYTQALISAIPDISAKKMERIILKGDVPSPVDPPSGCSFHPRCLFAKERCKREVPELREVGKNHFCRCFYPQKH